MTTLSPTEFFARSKKKFELALSRLRREHIDLALLSFQGSLEDALRGYLALRQNPSAQRDWETVLNELREDMQEPLLRHEVDRLLRVKQLQERIAQGESVTLTQDTLSAYKDFVADLLRRYGVAVAVSDDTHVPFQTEQATFERRDGNVLDRLPKLREQYAVLQRIPLVTVMIIVVLCILGASVTAIITTLPRQTPPAAEQTTTVSPLAETQPSSPQQTPPPLPIQPASDGLAVGQFAFVRDDVEDGLALREQPGTAVDVPVQVYLKAGTQVLVVDGPVDADGYTWWLVRAANQQGWCAGEFLVVQ